MTRILPDDRPVQASERTLSARVDHETVVLDMEGGVYYALNDAAAFVWDRLGEPATRGEIAAALCAEYRVPRARADADVGLLLDELDRNGLLRTTDEDSESPRP